MLPSFENIYILSTILKHSQYKIYKNKLKLNVYITINLFLKKYCILVLALNYIISIFLNSYNIFLSS